MSHDCTAYYKLERDGFVVSLEIRSGSDQFELDRNASSLSNHTCLPNIRQDRANCCSKRTGGSHQSRELMVTTPFQIWTHGNAGLLERIGSPNINTKHEINKAFGNDFHGDIVKLGDHTAAAFMRIGFEGRIVFYDHGNDDNPKSGSFWLHYPLPTIYTRGARAKRLNIRFATSDLMKIGIRRIHLWDGNLRRIWVDDDVDENMNYEASFDAPYEMGLSVSLKVSANNAKSDWLKIFGVGVDVEP